MDKMYIPYKLSSKVIDWKPKWFYIENHGSTLPMITLGPLVIRPEWKKKPLDTSQIPDLLKWIANLKQSRITREAVVFDWMKHRIQPLQARVTFGFEYQGTSGPSRYSTKEITNGEALHWVQRLLEKVDHVPHLLDTFLASNPPKEVCTK